MRNNKKGLGIGTIVILIIAAVLLLLLLTGGAKGSELMKKIGGALGGSDTHDKPLCEPYRTIYSKKNLTDLIILTTTGDCGGDTTEGAFKFNLTPSIVTTKYVTDTISDELCGTHTYQVQGLNRTITFGDIEYYEADDCGYNGDSWPEWQDCVSNDRDLVIVAPKNKIQDPCTSHTPGTLYSGYTTIACMHETSILSSHLSEFGLDPIQNPPLYQLTGTWAIKRAGEDIVICFIGGYGTW